MLKNYKSSKTRTQRFVGLMLAGAIALLAGGAPAAADETYVVDINAGTNILGALFRVDPISGNRALVSDFGNAAQGPLVNDPVGHALLGVIPQLPGQGDREISGPEVVRKA